jgi:beta-galactosidase
MQRTFVLTSFMLGLTFSLSGVLLSQESPRSHESFNQGWKFVRYFNSSEESTTTSKEAENLQNPSVNDNNWLTVNLPHDWAIEEPFSDTLENNTGLLPWKGIGWYRKHFDVSENDKNKRIYIDFDGAMANAKIWLNGIYVGEWPYGYTSFQLDLTPYILYGKENIIAVRLDTKNWDSRWYPGAGLYRNVWLEKTSQVHIAQNGIFCTTPEIKKEKGMLSVKAEVENHLNEPVPVSVKVQVFKLNDRFEPFVSPVAESAVVKATISGLKEHDFRLDIPVNNPILWNVYQPELYRVVVTVLQGSEIADISDANFGFRTLVFTPRDGLYINGQRVEIRGVCNHHDLGALGAAFNTRAAQRQLELLKEMGCNAIRTSHNPPAPELVDLCDKMGFVMEVEAFDCWRIGKKSKDYNLDFNGWHADDLKAMVRRDRNHPSVILWSIGNEVPDQRNPYLSTSLNTIVKSEDNTRPVTSGCDDGNAGTNGFQKTLDVFGINYHLADYQRFFDLKDNANEGMHSSESASTVSSRGEYFFPIVTGHLNENLPGKGIFQVTSYDVAYPSWASTPDQQFTLLDKFPAVYGEFVWTGFDYLGEPTPYSEDLTGVAPGSRRYDQMKKMLDANGVTEVPSRSSYFGIFDLAGFKKDRFYLYQSRWRPELPMAHILPHWNWPERKGLVTPVYVYTSGDEAELFLNGKSLGKKKKGQYEYRLKWDSVKYQPGELKVIAYRNGAKWAEDVMRTADEAFALSMSADRQMVNADGYDLIFITVRIEDKNKLLVPRSNNILNFSIEGPGKIIATDNGDATSHEPFQAHIKKAYNGMCLVIIAAEKGASGVITVKAESKGLKGSSVKANIEK